MPKCKGDDSGLTDDNKHQAKRHRTNAPVAIAKGNVPLQRTWEMTELSKGLLNFRSIVRLATDRTLEQLVNWEDQPPRAKYRAKKMVLDTLKAKPYEIPFQIAIHNRRKQAKATRDVLPASKRRGKAKQSSLHQGDGAQGASTAELVEKKKGELEERRKRKRDETTPESETDMDEEVTGEQRRPGDGSADPIVRTPPPAQIKKVARTHPPAQTKKGARPPKPGVPGLTIATSRSRHRK